MTELTCKQLRQKIVDTKEIWRSLVEAIDQRSYQGGTESAKAIQGELVVAITEIDKFFFDGELSKKILVDFLVGKYDITDDDPEEQKHVRAHHNSQVYIDEKGRRIIYREHLRAFKHKNLIVLPDNLDLFGDLKVGNSNVENLPRNLTVRGNLDIRGTKIKKIPPSIMVHKNLLADPELKSQIDKLKKAGRVKG